jgi:cysteine desulfurase
MKRIYLDNAATTPLDKEVLEAMMPYLTTHFGNPSSIHSYGRETRPAIEAARKTVAEFLNAHPNEIVFTSSGTESNNTAIASSVRDLDCKHIITSPIEHHSVLHTVEYYGRGGVTYSFVKLLSKGQVDLENLEEQLAIHKDRCLVTLMHANNEIGNSLDIMAVGNICKKHNAIFHSDCVQTIGHLPIDLRKTPVHFISGSAHKFHGPKSSGILYVNDNVKINPFILGCAQERNMRAGTENVYGIVGFAKALEIAMSNLEKDTAYIQSLRAYMIEQLRKNISGVTFNGDTEGRSLFTVLSISLPKTEKSEMILSNLDTSHICASGGSAGTSREQGSHVMRAVNNNPNRVTVRFSFSKYNTKDELSTVVNKLKELI